MSSKVGTKSLILKGNCSTVFWRRVKSFLHSVTRPMTIRYFTRHHRHACVFVSPRALPLALQLLRGTRSIHHTARISAAKNTFLFSSLCYFVMGSSSSVSTISCSQSLRLSNLRLPLKELMCAFHLNVRFSSILFFLPCGDQWNTSVIFPIPFILYGDAIPALYFLDFSSLTK
jgi:hypothetical protein